MSNTRVNFRPLTLFYLLYLFVTVLSARAQTSLNVTDFGAVGDAVQFQVNTVSNSTIVSVAGTNTFSQDDVGKVIEVFRAGPWVSYSNWGVVVTQQDIICLITNVSNGTNLSLSIPCGWTMTANCTVGRNNAPAFQSAINQASNLVATAGYTNVTINIPAGAYLLIDSCALDPNFVMYSMSDTHPALTISSGGITLLGDSSGDTTLLGCGAGMEHLVQGSLTWISPGYAPYVPMRDTMIWCSGPVHNNQYPLVIQNLTFDGGVQQGALSYNYWTPIQGNGEGWDTTHHAIADSDEAISYQMHQMKVITNCVFQHWRGEMLICWTSLMTNCFNDIANCTFYDGNATADNMYYGQHVHGCTFNQIEKVTEYYQYNANLPTVFENNLMTNIDGNILVINGATTNAIPPSYTIRNNIFYGQPNTADILFTPADNVLVSNNVFYGQAEGVSFSAAGLQPANGSAAVMSNILIVANSFNNTFLPIVADSYPVEDVLVSNNTANGTYSFAIGGGGWKTNWFFFNNTAPGQAISTSVQSGNYFTDDPSDQLGWYQYNDWGGLANIITYANGRRHQILHAMPNSTFLLQANKLIPQGALLEITNSSTMTVPLSAGVTLQPSQDVSLSWNGTAWATTNLSFSFSAAQTMGVSRMTVQFLSPSVDSGGNAITSWQWNFGDGTTGTGENPVHAYTSVGTFTPQLAVSNARGLSPMTYGPNITVTNPVVSFTASPTNACPNLSIQFRAPNVDSGGNLITNWQWNFGDGTFGSGIYPIHTYASVGSYSPSLTIINAYGISFSTNGPVINVSQPTIQPITYTPSNGVSRLMVQFRSPNIDSAGVLIKNWQWNFGDGTMGTGEYPVHYYSSIGSFTPSLTTTNMVGDTAASTGSAITVTNPVIAFTATPTNACPNLSIQFRAPNVDSGGNLITNWQWNFGDGTFGSGIYPTHTYASVGSYSPSLTVINNYGISSSTYGSMINVSQPTIQQITYTPSNGVSRLLVQFRSPNVDSLGVVIKSWQWNFGDGTTGTGEYPVHYYSSVGSFTPSLTITNMVGDTATSTGSAITVTNPVVSFRALPTNACPNLSIQFQAPGVDSGGNVITNWQWSFGDGNFGSGIYPTHTYTSIGSYSPSLTVINAYGISSSSYGPTINVVNPTIKPFTCTTTNGVSRLVVQFVSQGADSLGVAIKSWQWNFGDGTTGSGVALVHYYSQVGSFTPSLTITNIVGDTATVTGNPITVTNPAMAFTITPTNTCRNYAVQFRAPNVDSGGNLVTNWQWSFGDGSFGTGEFPTHMYTNDGTFTPALISSNWSGLSPTTYGPSVTISEPTIKFSSTVSNGVSRLIVQYLSPSVDSLGIPLKGWQWSFGDGTYGIGENPVHYYTNVGSYYPALTVTNTMGVTAAYSGPIITVTNPVAPFTIAPTNTCRNYAVQFRAPNVDSGGNLITNWQWNFGDGTFGSGEFPTHQYTNDGTFMPVLIMSNWCGISPTSYGPSVTVSEPTIKFSSTVSNGVSRLVVQYLSPGADSLGIPLKGWQWNFGDGTYGSGEYPVHYYTNVGSYYPALTVTNTMGVTAAYSGPVITVTNPVAAFTITPTNTCRNYAVQFRAPNVDSGGNVITNWQWNFGDGTYGTGMSPTHMYTNDGTFTPVLTMSNWCGISPTTYGPNVTISEPTIKFSSTVSNGVSRLVVQYLSPNIDSLSVPIKGWQWNFGDGTYGSGEYPVHYYTNVGTYYPLLTVTNTAGVIVSNSGPAITVTNPVAVFTATPTNTCRNYTVQFRAPNVDSGGNLITNWQWNFGDGTYGNGEFPTHQYTNDGTFTPVLTTSNWCGISPTAYGPNVTISEPTVSLSSYQSNGVSRLAVQYLSPAIDSLGVPIKGWQWSFGDGTYGSGEYPMHYYTNVGTYYPVLTVTNTAGVTATNTGYTITVTNPVIKYVVSPTNGSLPLTVRFSAPGADSGGNVITNWQWNFGDGTFGTGPAPVHIYTNNGVYTLVLTTSNWCGISPTSIGPTMIVAGNPSVPSAISLPATFVPSAPQLSLSAGNGFAVLSWPTNANGFAPQFATNIVPPIGWMNVTSLPTVINGQNVITNDTSAPQMFFRLSK